MNRKSGYILMLRFESCVLALAEEHPATGLFLITWEGLEQDAEFG